MDILRVAEIAAFTFCSVFYFVDRAAFQRTQRFGN
jgi:hypothetical protein